LALVKEIVERHGGAVAAEGRLGEGASFTLTLPIDAPDRNSDLLMERAGGEMTA
jgi:signal transduction histidine kinase